LNSKLLSAAERRVTQTWRPADESERLLIEAARQDPARFAELYDNNFDRVYAYIARRVRDRDIAQDLTAEVFFQALANLGRFQWRGVPFAAWLFRIAANEIIDRSKRHARERGLTRIEDAPDISIDIDMEAAEQSAELFKLVERLPADQRRVIVMRFAEQKSIREIGAELGRTEGAVKQLQFRGLQTLRARMTGIGGQTAKQ
jgi:RNA polymerase sigma-70 factor (ECF subfamily)